jgi:hypothetical protein
MQPQRGVIDIIASNSMNREPQRGDTDIIEIPQQDE